MAEIFNIDITGIDDQHKLLMPKRIEVPLGSIIQWNIKDFNDNFKMPCNFHNGLIFTLYFENFSPFSWKRKFIQIFNSNTFPKTIRIADDLVERKGEFKYGVNVVSSNLNQTIIDEDPLLIVY